MKKLVYVAALAMMATTGAFAQKATVKSAEKQTKDSNFGEARTLIKQALDNEETKNDPYAWYVAGLIEHKEYEKSFALAAMQKPVDTLVMYNALLSEVPLWLKVYDLEKNGKLDYAKDLKGDLRNDTQSLLSAGNYFWTNQNYKKSGEAFGAYVALRKHPLFADVPELAKADSALMEVSYFTLLSAFQAKEYDKAIELGRQFVDSYDYNKNEALQITAASAASKNDTTALLGILKEGVKLFPQDDYYVSNLVGIYANRNQIDEAINYLKPMAEGAGAKVSNLKNMGILYGLKGDLNASIDWYKKILAIEPNNVDANFNIGNSYIAQISKVQEEWKNKEAELRKTVEAATKAAKAVKGKAKKPATPTVDVKAIIDQINTGRTKLAEEIKSLSLKAVPYLEKAYSVDKHKAKYLLSDVYSSLGREEESQKVLKDADL